MINISPKLFIIDEGPIRDIIKYRLTYIKKIKRYELFFTILNKLDIKLINKDIYEEINQEFEEDKEKNISDIVNIIQDIIIRYTIF